LAEEEAAEEEGAAAEEEEEDGNGEVVEVVEEEEEEEASNEADEVGVGVELDSSKRGVRGGAAGAEEEEEEEEGAEKDTPFATNSSFFRSSFFSCSPNAFTSALFSLKKFPNVCRVALK